jgi:hypothetical protein
MKWQFPKGLDADELGDWLEEQGWPEDILDELVHETAQAERSGDLNETADEDEQEEILSSAEQHASAVNNSGFTAQIEYLLQQEVSSDQIRRYLKDTRVPS